MTLKLKIDPLVVGPWEIPALRTFAETWEHVLSSALMYSIAKGRRPFAQTEAVYKQATAQVRKYEQESLGIDAVVGLVAEWASVPQGSNKEEGVLAWAADPATEGTLAADRFAKSLFATLENRPQMSLPLGEPKPNG